MPDDPEKPALVKAAPAGELQPEPPVVARMVVEIRSDGSRTIARGAIEDTNTGQRTTIEAAGGSPIQLAIALARSLTQLPRLARPSTGAKLSLSERLAATRSIVRGLLGRKP